MGDWKQQLQKVETTSVRKCVCGKIIKKQGEERCYDCYLKAKAGSGANVATQSVLTLPKDYLNGGYFEQKDGKGYIKEEVFMSWAKDISTLLAQQGMTASTIRKFFTKLRAIESKFKSTKDFNLARQDMCAFIPAVTYATERGVAPHLFKTFIANNVEIARADEANFMAFIKHFESVIAYFKETKGGYK